MGLTLTSSWLGMPGLPVVVMKAQSSLGARTQVKYQSQHSCSQNQWIMIIVACVARILKEYSSQWGLVSEVYLIKRPHCRFSVSLNNMYSVKDVYIEIIQLKMWCEYNSDNSVTYLVWWVNGRIRNCRNVLNWLNRFGKSLWQLYTQYNQ